MKEATLLRISLLCTIFGVAMLFFVSKTTTPNEGKLLQEDQNYVIHGTISRITQRDKVTYIDLQKEDDVNVVLFKDYPVDLHPGDYIEAQGRASKDENGELQFIGNEIRVIK